MTNESALCSSALATHLLVYPSTGSMAYDNEHRAYGPAWTTALTLRVTHSDR